MANYLNGKPLSGLNSVPELTLAQYNALNVKPKFWVWTDAPESYKKLSADQVSYDSNNTVKDKLDDLLEVKTVEKTYTTDQYGHFSFGSEFNNGLNVIRVFALERQANRFVQLYTWNGNTIGLLTDGANSMANETNKYLVIYFE